MKRRAWLRVGAGTLGTLAVPAWIERAFAQDCCSEETLAEVTAAFARARQSMLPLLVLIVPPRTSRLPASRMRPEWFADWLLSSEDETLALLALVELVGTTAEHLVRVIPNAAAAGAGVPLMVLVETDTIPASAVALDAALERAGRRRGGDADPDAIATAERDARNAVLTRLVRQALLEPSRIRREEARVLASNPTSHPLIDYARSLRSNEGERANIIQELANRARARWVDGTIPGTSWGSRVLHECPLCGIGFTPLRSQRFLRFYIQ